MLKTRPPKTKRPSPQDGFYPIGVAVLTLIAQGCTELAVDKRTDESWLVSGRDKDGAFACLAVWLPPEQRKM